MKETRKRAFRRSSSNYLIDNNDNLFIKKYDKDNENIEDDNNEDILNNKSNDNFSNNNNVNKKIYTLFVIPYKIDEYELIKKIHKELNHRNLEDIRNEFI